jgi:hypothetical protein
MRSHLATLATVRHVVAPLASGELLRGARFLLGALLAYPRRPGVIGEVSIGAGTREDVMAAATSVVGMAVSVCVAVKELAVEHAAAVMITKST